MGSFLTIAWTVGLLQSSTCTTGTCKFIVSYACELCTVDLLTVKSQYLHCIQFFFILRSNAMNIYFYFNRELRFGPNTPKTQKLMWTKEHIQVRLSNLSCLIRQFSKDHPWLECGSFLKPQSKVRVTSKAVCLVHLN